MRVWVVLGVMFLGVSARADDEDPDRDIELRFTAPAGAGLGIYITDNLALNVGINGGRSYGASADFDEAATFECRLDGGAYRSCRSGDALGPLADGPHVLEVHAVDGLRNVEASPASRSFSVDTQVSGPVAEAPAKLKVAGGAISIPVTVSALEATDAEAAGKIAAGSATVPLPERSIVLASRARGSLKLAPASKGAKAVTRALKKRRPVTATVIVRFTDRLGNSATVTRSVKLVAKR